MNEPTEPREGDPVILHGRIVKLDGGIALVEVYRTYPVGGTVAVQCGALEYDDGISEMGSGQEPAEADRIAEAMRQAEAVPGRTVRA